MQRPVETVARRVVVKGDVQGVGFRWATRDAAEGADVAGWVRNLADGRVEAVLQGSEAGVERVLAWMRAGGPPAGRVDGLDAVEVAVDATLRGFDIRR